MAAKSSGSLAALGASALAYASRLVADVAPNWSVELHEAFPGEASLMLMPEAADDAIGPTYVLHMRQGGFRLDQFQWDTYSEIGVFASLADAVRALRARLMDLVSPVSSLRH